MFCKSSFGRAVFVIAALVPAILLVILPNAALAQVGPVSFRRDVMPVFSEAGCNTAECHGAEHGQAGLKLSLFGAMPRDDYAAIARADGARRIDIVQPAKSLLLQKATGAMPHKGRAILKVDDPAARTLLVWINQGARFSFPKHIKRPEVPQRLDLTSPKGTIASGESVQLKANLVFGEDQREDVTVRAAWRSSDPTVATVDNSGTVTAVGFGQANIIATAQRRSDVTRVVVPQLLPDGFPKEVLPDQKEGHEIDWLVGQKWKELGIVPSALCSDEVFLRRVSLDATGRLPTEALVRAFMADKNIDKRSKLIDTLLASDAFVDRWTLKWCDLLKVKSEYPSKLWPNAVQAYYKWIRHSVAQNKPYDQFVRELLTSSGSNFRDPPANYYRAHLAKNPQSYAEVTATLFMGARIGCASCHGHPTEDWTPDDQLGMAAFFSKIRFKRTLEWKEEVVWSDPNGKMYHPKTRLPVMPTYLGQEPLTIEVYKGDPRATFADWLIAEENPWFARCMANRIWFWLLGRGIVHEPDDIRPTNPPSNPELLAYLEKEFIESGYDVRHLFRKILNSRTYQLSSKTNKWNAFDTSHYSHYFPRRLDAEVLCDAIGQTTGTSETFTSRVPEPYTTYPPGFYAMQLADGTISTPLLTLFGRPSRDSSFESNRCSDSSMRLSLFFTNSPRLESKILRGRTMKTLLASKESNKAIVERLYLMALSRPPTEKESQRMVTYITESPSRNVGIQDVIWTLLNTREFMFNH